MPYRDPRTYLQAARLGRLASRIQRLRGSPWSEDTDRPTAQTNAANIGLNLRDAFSGVSIWEQRNARSA